MSQIKYKKENQKKEEIRNIRSRKGRTYGEKTYGKRRGPRGTAGEQLVNFPEIVGEFS